MRSRGNPRWRGRHRITQPDHAITVNRDEVWMPSNNVRRVITGRLANGYFVNNSEVFPLKKDRVQARDDRRQIGKRCRANH